eukprot:1148048-Pelagomonas_calceolata.AAC.15
MHLMYGPALEKEKKVYAGQKPRALREALDRKAIPYTMYNMKNSTRYPCSCKLDQKGCSNLFVEVCKSWTRAILVINAKPLQQLIGTGTAIHTKSDQIAHAAKQISSGSAGYMWCQAITVTCLMPNKVYKDNAQQSATAIRTRARIDMNDLEGALCEQIILM